MLEKEQWNDALDQYNKALQVNTPPMISEKRNGTACKASWRGCETRLRGSGVYLLFASLTKWQNIVDTARVALRPASLLISLVERQLNRIRLMRGAGFTAIMLIIIAVPLFLSGAWGGLFHEPTATPMPTNVHPTNTFTVAATPTTETQEPAASATPTILAATPTLTPPATLTPTMTQATLGIGYISKASASVWREPNTGLIGTLSLHQPLTLLEKRDVFGSPWYRCSWESSGEVFEGWILEDNITFNPPKPDPVGTS